MDPDTDWVDGKRGKALQFGGVDGYVDCGNDASLDVVDEFTIGAWVKWNEFKDFGLIVDKGNGGSVETFNYGLWSYSPASGYLTGWIGDGVGHNHVVLNGTLSTDTWHHVVFVADGSYLKLFVNGELNNEAPQTITLAVNLEPVRISKPGNRVIDGTIDEVKIYNRALSADEIKADYEYPVCLPGYKDCNGLPADWCEVNSTTDANNCGACDNKCIDGRVCIDGECVTPSEIPLTTSESGCGGCQTGARPFLGGLALLLTFLFLPGRLRLPDK
jgi:hypothetical protein